jgi:hypothetical protein
MTLGWRNLGLKGREWGTDVEEDSPGWSANRTTGGNSLTEPT